MLARSDEGMQALARLKWILPILLGWVLSAQIVVAQCGQLQHAFYLTDQIYLQSQAASSEGLDDLRRQIDSIDNDRLLALMLRSGHRVEFSRVRNILTQIRYASFRAAPNSPELTSWFSSQLQSDFIEMKQLFETICRNDSTSGDSLDLVNKADQGLSDGAKRTPLLLEEPRIVVLVYIIVALICSILLVLLSHIGIVVFRSAVRQRKSCAITASLESMLTPIDVQICTMGKLGCLIVPQVEMTSTLSSTFSIGLNCTLTVGKFSMPAVLIRHEDKLLGIRFFDPLTPETLRQLWVLSKEPVRFDYSVILNSLRSIKSDFGYGYVVRNK